MVRAMPPNLLLITTDQQRWDTINALGQAGIWTPHLDWLCDSGVAFTNAWSDCPVCMPARTTLMTGQHAYRHGVLSNRWRPDAIDPRRSLPGLLTAAGYQTRLIGKAHFGPERVNQGFEHMEIEADYHRAQRAAGRVAEGHGLGYNEYAPVVHDLADADTSTGFWTRRTMDFLETRDASRPFFCWLSYEKPHPPLDPTLSTWALYRDRPMPPRITGDWSATADAVPPAFAGVTRELCMLDRQDDAKLADIRRAYWALVSQIDYQLGLLIGRLSELNLLADTWIVFTSDHGEMLGDHFLGGKCVPFDGSARVPFIIRPPHDARDHRQSWRGTQCAAPVTLADVLPSLLGAAGVTAPAADCVDAMRLARGELPAREQVFLSCMHLHAVVAGRWKLCRETIAVSELLFDRERDPEERHDLLRAGTHADVAAALRNVLNRHLAEHHLTGPEAVSDPAAPKTLADLGRNLHPGWSSRRRG